MSLCLLLGALLAIFSHLVPSEAQHTYELCDNLTPDAVSINVTSPPFIIHSPKFGKLLYDNFQHCSLVFKSGKEPLILFLLFNSFDLEYQDDCKFDSLCVYGIKFCGNWAVGHKYTYILPEYSFFTLEFKTDSSQIYPGFEIKVTTESAINRTIWQVVGGVGSKESNVHKTSIKYQQGFSYKDRCMQVPNTMAQHTYEFCDNLSPNVVNINVTSPSVIIRSPKYLQGSYKDNQHCSLVLNSGKEPLILFLYFNNFHLEYHDFCNYDSLCIYGVKFCGNWTIGQNYAYILPENSSFTMEFKTDGSTTFSGFQIIVSTQPAVSQIIQQVTGGVGSSERNIQTTDTFTYGLGFSYTDKCISVPHNYIAPTTTESPTSPGLNKMRGVFYFCDNSSSNIMIINATSSPLLIHGSDSESKHNCSLIIREPLILFLNYSFFELVYQDSCGNDFLCLHGIKFCGIRETIQSYVIDLRELSSYTINIQTDIMVTRSDAQIQVSQELTTNKSMEVAPDGFGAHSFLVSTDITYYPKYQFKDRCMSEPNPTNYEPESKSTTIGQFVQEQISALISMAQMQAQHKSIKV